MATGPQSGSRPHSGGEFDFTKFFAEMKLPTLPDLDALTTANRRNIEAITAASRVAMEGAQAVARRQMEIVQQAMSEMTEVMKALSSPEPPQEKTAKQAEILKHAYQHAVSNLQELSDLIQRANADAMKLINARFAEAMDEVKHMAKTSG